MHVSDCRPDSRRGITLMEVLIAIGIFAIGLTSVASLLPAGGSQARKAIISDRAANLAENALADAVTIGVTRPDSHFVDISAATRVVVDPVGALGLTGLLDSRLRATGVLSSSTVTSSNSAAVRSLFGVGRDDIVYGKPATDDALPTNAVLDGARGFDGRTSCLWAIESINTSPLAAGRLARLSAVVFHDRNTDPNPLLRTVSATLVSTGSATLLSTGEILLTPPSGRTIREVLRSGTVLVVPAASVAPDQSAFFTLRSASPRMDGTGAYGVFDRQPPAGACTVLLDSVGLAQAIVTLEGAGPFSSTAPREVAP